MGRYIGCGASVCSLRRLRVGSFDVDNAVTLDMVVRGHTCLEDAILSIEDGLRHLPTIMVTNGGARRLRMGGQPRAQDIYPSGLDFEGRYVALMDEAGMIIGIARRSDRPGQLLKTERIL
jgi:tRNA U55 pseudouridine synthase TruB